MAERGDGRYALALDPDGILRIGIAGVWDKAQVDAFFVALAPLHGRARVLRGRACALVEVGAVQSPLVALHVRAKALAIKRPGDRTAMVIATVLSKLQITRLATSEGFGLFTDPAAALAWLRAP